MKRKANTIERGALGLLAEMLGKKKKSERLIDRKNDKGDVVRIE